ncbi:EAL domain-containing protein [Leptospira sp. 'Mane']|uniref:EAL domain-containing protein n=1 Tax=Leptospira sp. 'Mane' TaxID=3387407 RepID=UPI00398A9B36
MGSPLSLLVVESDTQEVFRLIREIKTHGFSPLYQVVSSWKDWEERVVEEDWDAILCSMNWQEGKTVLDLLSYLHQKNLDIPFILIAKENDLNEALSVMRAGAADIIEHSSLFRLPLVLERERRELVYRREKEITTHYLGDSLREIQFQKFALDQATIVSITDASGIITYINEKFSSVSGYKQEELIGRSHRILKSDEKTLEEWKEMWEVIQKGKVWRGEIKNTKKDGTFYWVDTTIVPFSSSDGSIFQYIAIHHDITDRKLAEDQLTYDAFYDSLTGLPNRALFLVRVEQKISEYNLNTRGFPIVISVNIDNFKRINNSLGNESGDDILRIYAKRIQSISGNNATVTRLGADTFAVLVVDFLSLNEANEFANRLLDFLKEIIPYNGYEIYLTASSGIAAFGMAGKDAEEILKNAEIAMFHSKESRIGTVSNFSQAMQEKIHYQLEIQNDLKKALERNEFIVYYQPIYDLKQKEIAHWEALVRWKHPKKGLVPPVDFIPMAEDSGLIVPLTKYVLDESCLFVNEISFVTDKVSVAINLSAEVFQHQNIFHWIVDVHKKTGIPFSSLQVEITESLAMKNMNETIPILSNLKDLGVKIALDDFGTGFSSLSYLEKLPLSIVKIDKSFLNNVVPGSKEALILVSIIHMAHDLGLKVIAEGVEDRTQFDLLADYKCDMIQGYLIAKPMALQEAKEFMQSFQPI